MPDHTNDPSRLELYQAGKLEERRRSRRDPVHAVVEQPAEEDNMISFRPEAIALALLVIVLLIVTAVAL